MRIWADGMLLAERSEQTTLWGSFKRLMLGSELPLGRGLLIEPRRSIPPLLARHSVDVVFYDRFGYATKVVNQLRPWIGATRGGPDSFGALVLPVGAAKDVRPGARLRFET